LSGFVTWRNYIFDHKKGWRKTPTFNPKSMNELAP